VIRSTDNPYAAAPPADFPGPQSLLLPGWVQAADFVAFGLLMVALTIGLSGGFRTYVGDYWAINLTSPLRVLSWSVAIALVRHYFVRAPSIYTHVSARAREWVRSQALKTAVMVSLATRPIVFLTGYLAVSTIGLAVSTNPLHEFENELFNLPLRWDTGWYLQIAAEGYSFVERGGSGLQQNIVFFPAYPMLVRGIALLLGNKMGMLVVGGTIASLACFLIALAYLYQLGREHLTDDQSAAALWMIAAYPFALFFGAIYTESLFLAGALGAFYHFRRGELARAGGWGLIVGLTRPNGLFLCLPLVLCVLAKEGKRRGLAASAVAAAMPAVGALLYSAFLWRLTGDPFAWAAGHAAWGRHYQGLGTLVADRYRYITGWGLLTYVGQQPYDFLNGLGVVFVLIAVWPVARRFSIAYAVFILVNMLPALASGGLLSAGRFSAVMFPAFLWLARVVPARHRPGWIVGFAALQALSAVLFYTWRPLF
jgi:Gpi18-like mannosyltransferase